MDHPHAFLICKVMLTSPVAKYLPSPENAREEIVFLKIGQFSKTTIL